MYVESIGSFVGVMLMLVHAGAFTFARDGHDINQILHQSNDWLSRDERLIAGLIVGSICAPLAEEFGKSIGVRLLFRPMTTRAQAFQLGAFAGAGFGFLEALLYGLGGIGAGLDRWWEIMLVRGGSTSLHVLCTGLASIGWWYWARAGRPRTAAALFTLAVSFHAIWNAFAAIISSRILGLDAVSDHTLEIVAYAVIAVVSLAFITAIPLVARAIRDDVPASVEGTPLSGMTPWLA
jgi:RsiW-degrading membrane proteinase PrsW (M82 family)